MLDWSAWLFANNLLDRQYTQYRWSAPTAGWRRGAARCCWRWMALAWAYWQMARATHRRGRNGDPNSVWALPAKT
ncbi:hypothetical protein [Xanthomonas graminis]|uniref:hypothetical protein n=1 Tax=Xanthomonas graminis TaxID=3390026 RepID=UPI000B234B7F|nr:hypothetical protein [Xanthomonas translucens]UKE75371.1 hypothetical protein KFS85_00430 [Xanthomonas translucens pv. phleipratensis]